MAWMCKRLSVSRSGYYAWVRRPRPARARRDQQLAVSIAAIHAQSRGTYGSPSIRDELVKAGESVGKKRVARLMRDQGLTGKPPKKFVRTTDSGHHLPVAKNLVQRQFEARVPASSGWPTSATSAPGKGSSTWQWSSTSSPAASSAGPSPTTCAPSCRSRRSRWRCVTGVHRRAWCITPTAAASTRATSIRRRCSRTRCFAA